MKIDELLDRYDGGLELDVASECGWDVGFD
jgi:hypothetical protein